jgi:hypothetical protein
VTNETGLNQLRDEREQEGRRPPYLKLPKSWLADFRLGPLLVAKMVAHSPLVGRYAPQRLLRLNDL